MSYICTTKTNKTMANTYFQLKKEVEYPEIKNDLFNSKGYTNKYNLELTAMCGGDAGTVQLTVQTESTLQGQNGIAYITLTDDEIDMLIGGLLERKNGIISATGYEQSKISPCID